MPQYTHEFVDEVKRFAPDTPDGKFYRALASGGYAEVAKGIALAMRSSFTLKECDEYAADTEGLQRFCRERKRQHRLRQLYKELYDMVTRPP